MTTYHILIVDDQLDVRRVLRSGLETLGGDFFVVDIPSGEEALLVSAQRPIDLLVADIRLAGMSGLELKQIVMRRNPGAKVILITGLTDPEIREEMSVSGADAMFYKPVDMADFLDAVKRCLGLVDTALPDSPGVETIEPGDVQEVSLSATLSGLRQELSATSVVLLDDNGQILAQAGDMPEDIMEPSLTPSLMAVFSASAKVSHDLGMKSPQDLLCFSGMKYDLYLTHVGGTFALLVVSDSHKVGDTRELVVSNLRPAVNDLLDVISSLGIPLQPFGEGQSAPPAIESEVVDEGEMPDLGVFFQQASQLKFNPQEVNDFWETAIDQSGGETAPDTGELSYEQARQLGLTPDDDV